MFLHQSGFRIYRTYELFGVRAAASPGPVGLVTGLLQVLLHVGQTDSDHFLSTSMLASFAKAPVALDKSQCFYTYKNIENIESFFKVFSLKKVLKVF